MTWHRGSALRWRQASRRPRHESRQIARHGFDFPVINSVHLRSETAQTLRFCSSSDGLRIACATMGHGPALVRAAPFLTHLEFDLESPVWQPWLVELSRQRQRVRHDARGCGLSDRDSAPQTLDAWGADLEAVVDAAGLKRFALLGCSQGSAISMAYAVRHPERVSCLVPLGGYSRGPMRRDPTPEQVSEAKLLLAGERALLELLASGLDNLQIAARNGLAEKTVRNKVSAVVGKLGVATRAQAIVQARKAGFGRLPLPR